jgi:hypothetical protein
MSCGIRSKAIALAAGYWLLSGCTYNVVLQPHPTTENTELPVSAEISIPEQTAQYHYDVSSATAGFANTFRIAVGPALVQYAEAFLRPVFKDGDDIVIEIVIKGFDVHDFEAHIDAQFIVTKDGFDVFDNVYHASGQGYYARTLWGGAFAMKSSMRETTHEALASLFRQFLNDAEYEYPDWGVEDDEF